MKNLSGIEQAYQEGIKDKIFVKVPYTPFHVVFTYVKASNSWNAAVVELLGTKRKYFARNITDDQMIELTRRITSQGNSIVFNFDALYAAMFLDALSLTKKLPCRTKKKK